MSVVKNLIRSALKAFDIGIMRYSALQKLMDDAPGGQQARDDIDFLTTLPDQWAPNLVKWLDKSKSQLRQDLFVLGELGFKTNGYFVEVGAAGGVASSNTYLMEKHFGWTGILAEPARCWQGDLKKSRSASIETNCVWRDSHSVLTFKEVDSAWYSTIDSFSGSDHHREVRKKGRTYDVASISLNDLLAKYDAPHRIDYLSIDTEGSELDILSTFDFRRHSIQVITCEHNHTPQRDQIFDLLTDQGYVRKFEELSKFDDWYVRPH